MLRQVGTEYTPLTIFKLPNDRPFQIALAASVELSLHGSSSQ
jgi:hypothetical protein